MKAFCVEDAVIIARLTFLALCAGALVAPEPAGVLVLLLPELPHADTVAASTIAAADDASRALF
jgi:hypothetical protein